MVDLALRTKLGRARRYWALLDAVAGAGWLLVVLLLAALLCFHLDRLLVLSPAARVAWLAFCGVLVVGGGAWWIGLPLLRRRTDESVAVRVERRYPDLGERLLSTVELAEETEARRAGISTSMIGALASETTRLAAPLRFESAFGLNGVALAGGLAALMTGLVLLHQMLLPDAMRAWWLRMTDPYGGVPVYRDTRVRLEPRDTVLLRGGDLAVRVATEGRPAREALLRFRFADGPWSTVRLTRAPFVHRFADLTESVSYYATASDGQSDVGHARVVDPPAVVDLDMRLRYPAYMARPDERLSGASGALRAPIGTRVAVRLTTNKPLRSAQLRLAGRSLGAWAVQGTSASGELVVTKSGTYGFDLRDTEGFANPQPVAYPIQAVPDAAPEVQVVSPAGDRELVPDGSLPLEGTARDDYGVRSVQLQYAGESAGARSGSQALAQGDRTRRSVEVAVRWNLGVLNLKPGDTLRYHLEADDYDNVTGPNVGRSSEYRIHIIDRSEMERRLAEQREDLQRLLEGLIRDQREARARVETARRSGDRKAIASAESQQRGLSQQATEAASRLGELSQALENNHLASPQELAAQAAARQSLSQLGSQAMPQAADRIAAAQSAANPRPDLADAARRQEEILRQLEQLRQGVRPMDDLQRLAEQAERLAQAERDLRRQAEAILPRTLGLSPSELAPDQRTTLGRLAQSQAQTRQATEQLRQRLESAAGRLQASDPNAAGLAREAGEQVQSLGIPERQSETENRLKSNALASAATAAGSLARDLQQIAESLGRRQIGLRSGALRRQLEQAMQQLERMMAQQREITQQTGQRPDRATAGELARQERQLQQQAQRMAQALARAGRQSPSAGDAAQSMQSAGRSLARAGSQLGKNSPGQASPSQQNAQQSMEQAAQALQDALNQMAGDREREELRQRLSQLAARQRAVNAAARRLDESRAGSEPAEGDRREMEQLAGKQGQVGDAAGGLQRRLPSEIFRDAMQDARSAMQRSQQGLRQHDPGTATRQAGDRAARLLDQMARALQSEENNAQQEGGQGGQQGQGGGGADARELQRRLADLRLLRSVEQGIREETGEQDQQPADSPERKEGVDRLTRRQGSTRGLTDRAARALRRFGDLSRRVGEAGGFMGTAHQGLQQGTTGDPTQKAEDEAVVRLSQAIQQAQQMAQQMAQQQGGRQQLGSQPQGQSGPAFDSMPVLGTSAGGARRLIAPGGRGFGPLSPREQRSLREGWREKIPPDYADLVNQYYRALSRQRH